MNRPASLPEANPPATAPSAKVPNAIPSIVTEEHEMTETQAAGHRRRLQTQADRLKGDMSGLRRIGAARQRRRGQRRYFQRALAPRRFGHR